jgi:hypothetical protein
MSVSNTLNAICQFVLLLNSQLSAVIDYPLVLIGSADLG